MSIITFIFEKILPLQLLGVIALVILFGAAVAAVQRFTHRMYYESVGWRGILWTAWIGVPVHELGHYFFAKLFRHRVERLQLFAPNEATGTLGRVDHRFAVDSWYQRVGNLFIGAAPLISGAIVILILLYFVAPDGRQVAAELRRYDGQLTTLWLALKSATIALFLPRHLGDWRFWIFLYVALSIATHSAPSRHDLKSVWSGLLWILGTIILVNAALWLVGLNFGGLTLGVSRALQPIAIIFFWLLWLSVLHALAAWIILTPFRKT